MKNVFIPDIPEPNANVKCLLADSKSMFYVSACQSWGKDSLTAPCLAICYWEIAKSIDFIEISCLTRKLLIKREHSCRLICYTCCIASGTPPFTGLPESISVLTYGVTFLLSCCRSVFCLFPSQRISHCTVQNLRY